MAKKRGRRTRAAAPRQNTARAEARALDEQEHGSIAVLEREPASDVRTPARDAQPRGDAWAALGIGAVAALIFASTFSTHVSLGDAPESVAGVKSLGILHAPGYPTYVLLGRLFGQIFAVGSWAFRLNLFSLVCSAATVSVVFLLARAFGASRLGSTIGALILATTASFWFNAGFAKHYPLSSLLVALAALCVVRWQDGGSPWLLLAAGLALGLCTGVSWELAAIMFLGFVALIAMGPRRPSLSVAGGGVGVLVVVAAGLLVFVMVRAGQHPAVNWGEATNPSRIAKLVTQQDFRAGGSAQETVSGSGAGVIGHLPGRFGAYVGSLLRDMGLGAIALAIAGAALSWRTLRRDRWVFLVVLAVVDLFAVMIVSPVGTLAGFVTVVYSGGYLVDTIFAVAVFCALGVDEVTTTVSRAVAEQRAGKRFRSRVDEFRSQARPWIIGGIVVLTIVPSLVVHYAYADHRGAPLADRYGHHMLDTLPHGATLLTYEFDWTFPITYLQTVDHVRPDVHVVAVKELGLDWYRQQVARDLHLTSVLRGQRLDLEIVAMMHALQARGPVYADVGVTSVFRDKVGYESHGLVAEIVSGGAVGPHVAPDLGALRAQLDAADRHDGLLAPHADNFPKLAVPYIYERAHVELAKQYAKQGDLAAATAEIEHAAAVFPADKLPKQIVRYLRQSDTPRAKALEIIMNM